MFFCHILLPSSIQSIARQQSDAHYIYSGKVGYANRTLSAELFQHTKVCAAQRTTQRGFQQSFLRSLGLVVSVVVEVKSQLCSLDWQILDSVFKADIEKRHK